MDRFGAWRGRRRCRVVRGQLLRFLDGEIAPEHAERIAEHLAVCDRCCHDCRVWRAVIAHLRDLREPPDPGTVVRLELLVDELPHAVR